MRGRVARKVMKRLEQGAVWPRLGGRKPKGYREATRLRALDRLRRRGPILRLDRGASTFADVFDLIERFRRAEIYAFGGIPLSFPREGVVDFPRAQEHLPQP